MKIPYLEIIKKEDSIQFFLIEDLLYADEHFDLFGNYHTFWNLTNSLINSLEHYFKFESIHSLKECLALKQEIDKLYKRNIVKEEDSIYLRYIRNPEFDYKSCIYETKDTSIDKSKLSFLDIINVSNLNESVNIKNDSIDINNLPTKPGRGQKLCKNKECNKVIGARSSKCKYCGK